MVSLVVSPIRSITGERRSKGPRSRPIQSVVGSRFGQERRAEDSHGAQNRGWLGVAVVAAAAAVATPAMLGVAQVTHSDLALSASWLPGAQMTQDELRHV